MANSNMTVLNGKTATAVAVILLYKVIYINKNKFTVN